MTAITSPTQDFFAMYQRGIDSFREQTNRRFPDSNTRSFKLEFSVNEIVENAEIEGLFSSIYIYSNINLAPQICDNFNFIDIELENNRFKIFGTSHNGYDYAVDIISGKVAILESISGVFFFDIAEDEVSFLKVLIKMFEFSIYYIEKIKVTGELTRQIRKECIELAGGNKYAKLYNFIIISEDDQPEEEFTLP